MNTEYITWIETAFMLATEYNMTWIIAADF